MELGIICNHRSGGGKPQKVLPDFIRFLDSRKISWRMISETEQTPLSNLDRLVIIGGDGTINYTLNRFTPLKIPFAVIPAGTGNDFASMYLGNKDIHQSFETALSNNIQPIDAGICNGRLFINGIGIGFDGAIAGKVMNKKWINGPSAYYYAVLSQVLFFKSFAARITINKHVVDDAFMMICIANGISYGGGFMVTPLAQLSDGLLDCMSVTGFSPLMRVKHLNKIKKGLHLSIPGVSYNKMQQVHITSNRILPAHADGEFFESQSFEVSVLKDYLQLVFPCL